MYRVFADRLLDLTEGHAEDIAGQWCKSVRANPRTSSYHSIPEEKYLSQAVSCYKSLKSMYFSKKPYEEARAHFTRYAEDTHDQGIPLHEAVYALIMMRREIWLFADFQTLYTSAVDLHQAVESINRVLLVFDYAMYVVAQRYHEITG